MAKKFSIEFIKSYVAENSQCEMVSSEYINSEAPMRFKCSCGEEFVTSFEKFRLRNKRQCNACAYKAVANRKKLPYEDVKRFIEVESGSGCTLLSTEYKDAHDKLSIRCSCGKPFEVKWNHFKNSNQRQCPACGLELRASRRRLSAQYVRDYIKQSGCELLSEYKNLYSRIEVRCPCGNTFSTVFSVFRDYDVRSCKICREQDRPQSKGEDKIEKWLVRNGVGYKREYTFDDCKHTRRLKFDFAVFNSSGALKMLVEFDGKQHHGLGLFSDDTDKMVAQYLIIQESDQTKNEYCFRKGIPLLRISYNNYKNIDTILNNALL